MDGIAIIGMFGRFPGAPDLDAYWRLLSEGREGISHFSADQVIEAGADPDEVSRPNYVRAGGVLDAADHFDANFFGFSNREAAEMDPQHRVFLEGAWAAFENAGYAPESFDGDVGVYAGASLNTYLLNNLFAGRDFQSHMNDLSVIVGNGPEYMATRVSHQLGLSGPSFAVNAACATSLVAVAQACQGLLDYQCDMAVAGGVSVRVPQARGYLYVPDGILSPDGHCRPFDALAGGTVFGNGVGIVVLKRLEDARTSHDTIHAVIRGFAVNNDGAERVGYTAPGVRGQSAVISQAYAMAGFLPEAVSFVEAHGTGTELGDPIEIAALTEAFDTSKRGFCALGSVKSNIGHLDAAAGIAGLIKVVLSLEHGMIPPSIHFEKPNRNIDFNSTPFFVNDRLRRWESDGRRAGVSSFGIGGTNVHVALESAPDGGPWASNNRPCLITVSARTPSALEQLSHNLGLSFGSGPEEGLPAAAFTLMNGRKAFAHRRALVASSSEDAAAGLINPRRFIQGTYARERPVIGFLFPGQGAQYINMGRGLYEHEPVFRDCVDEAADYLLPFLDRDLRTVLYPIPGKEESAVEILGQTAFTQPALFVVECALAQWWNKLGIRPAAMLGHSLGEVVAACISGVFCYEDALDFAVARGRLMQEMPPGGMLAIRASEKTLRPLLVEPISLAVVNGVSQCVAAGPNESINELKRVLEADGIACKMLRTSHAFHSSSMEPMLDSLARWFEGRNLSPPEIPFVSNVTGTWITPEQAIDPSYWVKHVRETVRFGEGLHTLMSLPGSMALEVGPWQTLGMRDASWDGLDVVVSLPRQIESVDDRTALLEAAGKLWIAGVPLEPQALFVREERRRVPLPTYPFESVRHWVEPDVPSISVSARRRGQRKSLDDWFLVPTWSRVPLIRDEEPDIPSSWLVFVDGSGLGELLLMRLMARGHRVSSVITGPAFRRTDDHVLVIEPHSAEDHRLLFEDLAKRTGLPNHIVFLACTIRNSSVADKIGAGEGELPIFRLLRLVGALGSVDWTDPVDLTVVSSGLYEVTGDEPFLSPELATMLGPVRALPFEFPGMVGRNVDLMLPENGIIEGNIADHIINEIIHGKVADVAFRGAHRWVRERTALAIEDAANLPKVLRRRGIYLISGGTGGIGHVLAEYLAETFQARLILVGRTVIPKRGAWNTWLAEHDVDDPKSIRIRRIRRLEELGAEVMVAEADVCDIAAMESVFARSRRRFGRINGIIHAAGVPGGQMMVSTEKAYAMDVLRPKVQGTRVLASLSRDDPPDVFVLCSSVAAEWSGVGQAVYSGANAFLDSFAHSERHPNGLNTVSINWDVWAEVGMAREAAGVSVDDLRQGLKNREGIEVFVRALRSGIPQIIVSTCGPESHTTKGAHLSVKLTSPSMEGETNSKDLPGNDIELAVSIIWGQMLGIDTVRIHDDFFELGGNSLLATQLNNRLRKQFDKANLSLRSLFDHPTVAGLSALIGESYPAPGEFGPLRQRLDGKEAEEQKNVLRGYLHSLIKPGAFTTEDRNDNSPVITKELIGNMAGRLVDDLSRHLNVTIHGKELATVDTLEDLVDIVFEALNYSTKYMEERCVVPSLEYRHIAFSHPVKKNASMVFVLSTPRSGSTLFRLMLSAHPKLFCPPELTLLSHPDMRSWAKDPDILMPREGLLVALTAIEDGRRNVARSQIDKWVKNAVPTGEVIQYLQARLGDRVLVDKSPANALQIETLLRAEQLFEAPKYLHLVRHPYAMIESFIRARFGQLRGDRGDPEAIAEMYWRVMNENIVRFGKRIGANRLHTLRFEHLVAEPEPTMRTVCDFLQLPFEDAVLDPYGRSTMAGGPGDPNIHRHAGIDPALGTVWLKHLPKNAMDSATRDLAIQFGYELSPDAIAGMRN